VPLEDLCSLAYLEAALGRQFVLCTPAERFLEMEPFIAVIWTSMSTESHRIAYQLASTINGEAWYGDSLRQILADMTAEQAQTHPIPNAHSIWELLCHIEAWVKFALGAVDGAPIPPWPAMPVELDWPPVTDTSEAAWQQTVDSFFSHHLRLVEMIKGFSDERLEAPVPGRTYNFYRLFQSATQHAVYHAGQIALLKKIC
jgi:DinB superfamily